MTEEVIELFESIVKIEQNRGISDGFCYMVRCMDVFNDFAKFVDV